MALPGYCKQALTDLPTNNINTGVNYFVLNEKRWYFYNGTVWIKHEEKITDTQLSNLLNLPSQVSSISQSNADFNNVLNSMNVIIGNINTQIQSLQNNGSGGSSAVTRNYTELLLQFDGPDGETNFIDDSKHNSLIIPIGNPVTKTSQSKFGNSSLYLNGSSFLSVANTCFKSDFTIECWVKTSTTNLMTIISQDPGGYPVGNAWTLLLNEASQNVLIGYYNYTVGGSSNLLVSRKNILDNEWHHLAVVRNKTTAYLYVDGDLSSTYENWNSLNMNNTAPFFIGAHNGMGRFFNGYIDNLRISSRAIYTPNYFPKGFTLPDQNFNVYTKDPDEMR